MKKNQLTSKEQKVLYGMVKYPQLIDTELSKEINIKSTTLTSIKKRLSGQGYFRKLTIPMLNLLGSELLAVIYTQFNPVIPLEERIKTTKKTIEVFDEIFYSVGEQDKGFSISMSKNYSNIGRINDIRTETFGKVGLLEEEYPNEIIFPFENSCINRFFDFSRMLNNFFSINDEEINMSHEGCFPEINNIDLSDKEKKVYSAIVENPDSTTQKIGDLVGFSRHTISRMKKQFFNDGLLKQIVVPDLKKLGFEILAFYPIKFSPNKSPGVNEIDILDSYSTFFLARRQFETVIISAYPTYQAYKDDKMKKIRFLKENDFISYTPLVGKYMFESMVIIKEYSFAPIAKKILKVS